MPDSLPLTKVVELAGGTVGGHKNKAGVQAASTGLLIQQRGLWSPRGEINTSVTCC